MEQLHQKVLLFSVGCVVEDITSTHSGSLALIQRHSRLQCALTAALAAGVNDAAEASRSLQRFSVELFDGFSKAVRHTIATNALFIQLFHRCLLLSSRACLLWKSVCCPVNPLWM